MTTIPFLVDKLDNFEIVALKIAEILLTETASQQALAVTAGKEHPEDWKIRVFSERSNPWGAFLNGPVDQSPLVNIWYDNLTFDPATSNTIDRQKADAIYNIDCYAYGISADVSGGGHEPGDEMAALHAHRTVRLVRNWLMSPYHTKLDLKPLVWHCWIPSIRIFQPQESGALVQNVIAARIDLAVQFNETVSPAETEILEFLSVVMRDEASGEITLQADYDYTV
jgi:hypothetical protein